MERRRASSVNVNALRVDGGPETRAMLTDAQAGAEGAFGNKDHTAVIDGEPEEGTGQAGPPSSSINSTPKGKTTGKSGSLRNVGFRRVSPVRAKIVFGHPPSSSRRAFASLRSAVSKPSVNQP